jgi:hypothetical protein
MNITDLFLSGGDALFATFKASRNRLRYQGKIITPTPIIDAVGVQGGQSTVSSQLTIANEYETVTTTIPYTSLQSSLGANWQDALAVNALWEFSLDEGVTWEAYQVVGTPDPSQVGRYGITLQSLGANDYGAT